MKKKKKDFLTLLDYTDKEVNDILGLSSKIKENPRKYTGSLANRTLLMFFEKTSTRTRISFETAMTQLGGHAIFAESEVTKVKEGESISDTAQVLSRYCDAIMARVYKHKDLELMAREASIPVINGLSELYHPCQILADLLTIKEKKEKFPELTMAFVGDCGFNMCHSLMIGTTKMGMNFRAVCPDKGVYQPQSDVMARAKEQARGSISIIHDPVEGVKDADIVVTDTWISPGQEDERQQRLRDFKPFQVNPELVEHAKDKYIFMHCLPAFRGYEVVDGVIDSQNSVVFDEAENRLHTEKALLLKLIKKDEDIPLVR